MTMGSPVALVYEGKEYASITAFTAGMGISYNLFRKNWRKAGRPRVIKKWLVYPERDCSYKEGKPLKVTCPISLGLPTKMSKAAFEAACAQHRDSLITGRTAEIRRIQESANPCPKCNGKVPAEIEIISIKEQRAMASKTVTCEVCGEVKSCHSNHNQMMCFGCISCRSLVRKKPEAVVDMLLEVQGEDYLVKSQKIPAVELAENPEQRAEIERLREQVAELEESQEEKLKLVAQVAELQQDLQHSQVDNQELIARIAQIRQMENETPTGGSVLKEVRFGESLGVVLGVLGALQLPIEWVVPHVWKRRAGLRGKDKDAARTLAMQRHPEVADNLKLKKNVGRAEAILIATFGEKR